MKTNGFYAYDSKFIKTKRMSTAFHGKKYHLQTPLSFSIYLDSKLHKNIVIGMSRKEGIRLAKAILKEVKIKRQLRIK